VKHGFTTTPPLSDEFGTAHNSNVNASKVSAFFSEFSFPTFSNKQHKY